MPYDYCLSLSTLATAMYAQTREVLSKCPAGYLGKALVTQALSDKQWGVLEEINQSLTQEYSIRRQMLLTRCDVTIQSFGWSDKIKVS